MKRIAILTCAAALAACASTGPVQLSKDTYMISKVSAGGMFVQPASIRAEIIREASTYCAKSGKVFQINSYNDVSAAPGRMPSSEINFMCLDENDPEIKRVKRQAEPTSVIEVRQR